MSASDWFSSSIMAKRGVASGKTGRKHRSTDAEQGAHTFVYGPYVKPIMTLEPGDTLVVDTEDAFSGKITSETDKPTEKLKHPFLNPQSGPFAVAGAETGDCLAVSIEAIDTRGEYGTTALIPEFGGLVGTTTTALLNPPLPEKVKRMRIDAAGVHFSDKIVCPTSHSSARSACRQSSKPSHRSFRTTMAATWTCRTSVRARSSICR